MTEKYRITKILSNNSMIVELGGKEKLLVGKGIAFGKKAEETGELSEQVEKVFVIEEQRNMENFQQLLNRNEEEFVGFCEEQIWELSKRVQIRLQENIHVGLIDHLSCTLRRLRTGEQIVNPFLPEIEVLYAKEMEHAGELCRQMEKKYKVKIPRGEVGFVALHIHSAMYNGKLQEALKSNRICSRIIKLLEQEFHASIDRQSFDCARFLVHLTYVMKRLVSHSPIENELADVIIKQYPKSFLIAQKISGILEQELKAEQVSKEETAFLTMHVERLAASIR